LIDYRPNVPWRIRLLTPVLIFVGLVVAVIGSLGAPLVPTVARVDHTSLAGAQWSLTITLLVGAVLTPVLGRLGDGPHRRATILAALGTVVVGCALAAVGLGFAALLAGRALQGVGLGLVPLAIATARDALPGARARSAIALLSVTTVAGIGVGYPIAGLITEVFGLGAAYWFGALVAALALLAALTTIPGAPDRPARRIDLTGAVLLGAGVTGLLLALTQGPIWGWTWSGGLGLVSAAVLAAWVRSELRSRHPLVDLHLIRRAPVLTADVTILFGGVGMYLLLSLVARFVQTPPSAGYGFDSSVVVAGLVLVPFSIASFVAGRVAGALRRREPPVSAQQLLTGGFALVAVSIAGFILAHEAMWQILIVMATAGFGVGVVFAANPMLIVSAVPATETGSAMSFNQVLRNIGFSVGSALAGLILSLHTPVGHIYPTEAGYGVAGLIAAVMCVGTLLLGRALPNLGRTAASV
jgi:MFS family permease